ncbi:MAG: YggS family pyridoxal phosphate-dependent enzyme [Phycisphaerae bacterium]|nr:YggS family pyridoxal phosphate-dependent enzyme [Gemmatimonadaceae bacterium]
MTGVNVPEPAYDAFVAGRVLEVRQRIAQACVIGGLQQEVTLVAVTKTHGPEAVVAAWRAGVRDVGENKVQEAESKMQALPADVTVRWHLIGHLQRNKAKGAVRFALVHSIDSERLALAVNDAAKAAARVQDVLVQVNVSGEASKGGITVGDVPALADRLHECQALRVVGVMTMAPFDAPEVELRRVFSGARAARDGFKSAGHPATALSMGMSDDFEVAVQEGATLVRLGTVLFGHRASP